MGNQLHAQFRALADPTRLAVVERLLRGAATVSELAKPFDMALAPFMKHLSVLERSGVITSKKVGRIRICAINPKAMARIEDWFSDRRALWESRLNALESYLDRNRQQ
ncbi:MAG: metalloregulator ArsR/SmtB family transcription factor [Methylocystis sp.]|uniref:ArsR/SmtB family transcription factor n=1 Tax=Methylocystis sp. TaxID=1911079 RepID=UPI003935CB12